MADPREEQAETPGLPVDPEDQGLSMAELRARSGPGETATADGETSGVDIHALEASASSSNLRGPSPADSLRETLDDDEIERGLTMAQLQAQIERERELHGEALFGESAKPRARDDELLDAPPRGEHHLGRLGGWRAVRKSRWVVVAVLGTALVAGTIAMIVRYRELEQRRLHPMPEVEATISPDTPREMTFAEGRQRLGLGREAPHVNVIHLPDRDITLAEGADKAQFKVEVRDGRTLRLKVMSGEIRETLTVEGAEPLLGPKP